MNNPNNGFRLHVYLSHCGVASRRQSKRLVEQGQVRVNGRVDLRPGRRVTDEEISWRGRTVRPVEKKVYIALHKPPGYICSRKDDRKRPLAGNLVQSAGSRLFSVGRLDFNSSGLLLFTNDGQFAHRLAHPGWEIEKEYLVETQSAIKKESLERFKKGLRLAGVAYRVQSYRLLSANKVRLSLTEGKNREIRRLFAAARLEIKRVHRLRVGPIRLGRLAPGNYRRLKDWEIKSLDRSTAKNKNIPEENIYDYRD